MGQRISNQSGQTLVLGLALLPICLTMISCFLWLSELLLFESNQNSLCRSLVLEQTKISSESTNKILEMNKLVIFLRVQKKLLIAAIAAASASQNYELIPPLETELQAVEEQQQLLAASQRLILETHKAVSVANSANGVFELKAKADRFTILDPMQFIRPNWSNEIPVDPADSEQPPIYEISNEKLKRFRMEYKWHVLLKQDLPFLQNIRREWKGQCSATIRERNSKWEKMLNWDKH